MGKKSWKLKLQIIAVKSAKSCARRFYGRWNAAELKQKDMQKTLRLMTRAG
nr:MAG TPA: hypothetical protein [Caudoviricetes sp.]